MISLVMRRFVSIVSIFCILPCFSIAQEVEDVPSAFLALSSKPELFLFQNDLKVPTKGGHLQGVQVIRQNGLEKLLVSGSSASKAYILQADLESLKTEKVFTLMQEPFRHAGGFQVSEPYLAVGIEDNIKRTISKVCLYDYDKTNLYSADPNITIVRLGEPKAKTAGSVGLIKLKNHYLSIVSNWDSRNWDFYSYDPVPNKYNAMQSFVAPDDWPNYQSINLVKDSQAIYAIGFYQEAEFGKADLILVSKLGIFEPIMELVQTKTFKVSNGVDFHTAAGLHVDSNGKLHIWATQRDALTKIAVNKFSQL